MEHQWYICTIYISIRVWTTLLDACKWIKVQDFTHFRSWCRNSSTAIINLGSCAVIARKIMLMTFSGIFQIYNCAIIKTNISTYSWQNGLSASIKISVHYSDGFCSKWSLKIGLWSVCEHWTNIISMTAQQMLSDMHVIY